MRGRHAFLFACAFLVLVASASPAMARAGRAADEDRIAEAMVSMINAERQARGLAALEWASDSYAQQRADDQPDGGTDHHGGFDAKTSAQAQDLGSNWLAAETLYYISSGGSAGDAVRGWMGSSVHRNVLMSRDMDRLSVGVSCRDGELHAVAHVGSVDGGTMRETAPGSVTSSSGPECGSSAPPAPEPEPEPEPVPEPEPEPEPAPAAPPPPAPRPEPSPTPTAAPAPLVTPDRPTPPEPPSPARLRSPALVLEEIAANDLASSVPTPSAGQGTSVADAGALLVLLLLVAAGVERRRARERR
ncbi:MAG TPA: CAP domain-containing protein [Nitriliruptorales bacterium]